VGTPAAAKAAVSAAGGTVDNDLSSQIGVLVAESSLAGVRRSALLLGCRAGGEPA